MRFISSFGILFSFWIIFSGKFDAFHLALGVVSVLIVVFWSGDYLISDYSKSTGVRLQHLLRFELYVFWLVWEIIVANFQVVFIALHPNMKRLITSHMVTFDSKLKGELAKFVLAQSITLTPGTVTVRLNDGRYLVHALTEPIAAGFPGDMPKRVANIFGEDVS